MQRRCPDSDRVPSSSAPFESCPFRIACDALSRSALQRGMLLRQLQRPLTRSPVATAAASSWRTFARPYSDGAGGKDDGDDGGGGIGIGGGSGSGTGSDTNSGSSGAHENLGPAGEGEGEGEKKSQPRDPTPPSAQEPQPPGGAQPQKKPLFEELFPAEARSAASAARDGGSGRRRRLDLDAELDFLEAYAAGARQHDRLRRYDSSTVLALGGASKQLAESDFLRLGFGRARHVEGWSSAGIARVSPVRDPHTLEPRGEYSVVFESGAAAAAWRREVQRLWELARARATARADDGAKSRNQAKQEQRRFLAAQLDRNQDAVRQFTLVAPSQRWDLERPFYTRREQLLERGGTVVEKLMRKAGTRSLVLISIDGGKLSKSTLRAAIHDDGIQRNLAWRVKGLDSGGIMAFGKSMLQAPLDASTVEDAARQQGDYAVPRADDNADHWERRKEMMNRELQNEHRRWDRFVVPFLDDDEALRFVRNWHRRQLTLRMGHEDSDVKEWEENRTLNVSMLW